MTTISTGKFIASEYDALKTYIHASEVRCSALQTIEGGVIFLHISEEESCTNGEYALAKSSTIVDPGNIHMLECLEDVMNRGCDILVKEYATQDTLSFTFSAKDQSHSSALSFSIQIEYTK